MPTNICHKCRLVQATASHTRNCQRIPPPAELKRYFTSSGRSHREMARDWGVTTEIVKAFMMRSGISKKAINKRSAMYSVELVRRRKQGVSGRCPGCELTPASCRAGRGCGMVDSYIIEKFIKNQRIRA